MRAEGKEVLGWQYTSQDTQQHWVRNPKAYESWGAKETSQTKAEPKPTATAPMGERLFPLVGGHLSDMTPKITGMLLGLPDAEVTRLLGDEVALKQKVEEAAVVLGEYREAKAKPKVKPEPKPKTKTKTKPQPKSPAVPLPYRLTVWTPSDLMGEEGQTVAFPSKMEAFAAFRDLQRQNLAGRALIRWFGQELMRYDGLASDEIEWNDKKPNPFRLTLWVMSDKLRENGQTLSFNTKIEAYAAFKDLRNQDLGVVCAVMTEDGDDIMRWDVMTDDDVHWTMEEAEADALDQAYAGISARTIALR